MSPVDFPRCACGSGRYASECPCPGGALAGALLMFVVYENPRDLVAAAGGVPLFAARMRAVLADGTEAVGPVVSVARTLDACRRGIPSDATICVARAESDDPCIVETWL